MVSQKDFLHWIRRISIRITGSKIFPHTADNCSNKVILAEWINERFLVESYKSVNLVKAHAISIVVFVISEVDAVLYEPVQIRDREVRRDVKGELSAFGPFDDSGDFIDQIGHFEKRARDEEKRDCNVRDIRHSFDSSQSDNLQYTLTV